MSIMGRDRPMAVTHKQLPGIRYTDKEALLKILEEYNRETGFVPDPNVTAQEVREMMIACGVRPEENSASREIMRIREGEES